MYIMDSAKKTIHDTAFIERITLSVKPDAALVCAAVSTDKPLLTLGRYANEVEARAVLLELFAALGHNADYFEMPDSTLYSPEQEIRDARTRRKGGS